MVRERWVGNYLDIDNEGDVDENRYLTVTNPRAGSQIKVPKSSLARKERGEVEVPATGEILVVDTRSGKIISE